ncbi:PKD domain-containing protein [Microbulbifer sp. SH-1]|uniref:PKD domain-containing protein n=1 Tax=Microbulbifer sp. SH-1 TaxID=2681547 RepID=UPI0014096148|nr:PKD domain-containing protein [Microbulbifer sp. SH-1]QIL91084.1 PKD domain-containing protein [Microbulbifer sp. SH-1]
MDGIFLDSRVVGLSYTTTSGLAGTTDARGKFQFRQDDHIVFSVGNIAFPEVAALPVMTPFDLFALRDFSSNEVINTLVLLQTLDDDGDIENAIVIPQVNIDALAAADIKLADLSESYKTFLASAKVKALIASLPGRDGPVMPANAIRHFSRQLAESTLLDFDGDGLMNNVDPDDDNDGVADELDQLPWNPDEQRDFDGDYLGDNTDKDDDQDGLEDATDNLLELVHIGASAAEGIADTYVDADRGLLYISNKSRKRVEVLDLYSGDLLQYFTFDHAPERMAATPDGRKLYVALLEQEHSSYWWEEDQLGHVAIVDLESRTLVKTLTLNIDPFDLVVTSGGKLVVTSGSGQWTNIIAYDADTGVELGRMSNHIYQGSYISLHSDEQSVFVSRSSSSEIEKLDISGAGIVRPSNVSTNYNHRAGYDVWTTPDGKYVIAGAGDLFLASDLSYVKSITPPSVTIHHVHFDTARGLAWLMLSDKSILIVNLSTFEAVTTDMYFGNALGVHTHGDSVSYFLVDQNELITIKKQHPCADCGNNSAPVARYAYTPTDGNTTDLYTFDASTSSDSESSVGLKYRWDIDNDGQWEADFSSSPILKHRFTLAGLRFVRLQVKDPGGVVSTAVKSVNVAQGIDPGVVVEDAVANSLNFNVTEVQEDKARNLLYITDKAGKRLYVVNVTTGLTERYFEFDFMPERMTMTSDGSTLYLALLAQEHSSYWWEEEQYGYIAEIDLQQLAYVRTFKINTDPYDLVVTDAGKLIVSSGSGQWTDIYAYEASTGKVLGNASISQASRLTLHPSQNWVFAADTGSSPSDFEKFDISGAGIVSVGDSPYHGDHRINGNVWATPDGKYLITRGGDIFNASDMTFVTNLTAQGVYIEQLTFDPVENTAFALTSADSLQYFNMTSWLQVGSVPVLNGSEWISVMGGKVVALAGTESESLLTDMEHPCTGCGANTAPTASFEYAPETGNTSNVYEFDGSASSDSEDGSAVLYRWDLNGDGKWDSAFSSNSTAEQKYLLSGSYQVRLQIRDSGGLTSTRTKVVSVAQGIDNGVEVSDSAAHLLDFTVTEMEVDLLRSKAYISDKSEKRLYVVDLLTGLTERYFEFPAIPERMAITPDGSKLYLALLSTSSNAYRSLEEQLGYVAVFDLEQQAHVNTLPVAIDPYDLVVTDAGQLVVSGRWNHVQAYDADSGNLLSSLSVASQLVLALSPSQKQVFAVQSDSYSYIYKLDISGIGIDDSVDSVYLSNHRVNGNIWVSPDGNYLISRGGDIFRTSDLSFVFGLTSEEVRIEQLAFDTAEKLAFALLSDGSVQYFNLSSWLQVDTMSVPADTVSISVVGSSVFVVSEGQTAFQLSEYVHPCIGCGANTAPVAAFSVDAAAMDTANTFTFDASGSIDNEDGDALQYRWDLNGDGEWDGDFSTSSSASHNYILAGSYLVRMQVRDSGGLASIAQKSLSVAQGVNTGIEVTGSIANQLDFAIADFVVDQTRNKAYFSDKSAKRLYVVNLLSGLTERYFEFEQMPERLAITPDGSKLYLALLVQEHSSYWWEEDQYGYVAEFDPEQQAHINTILVATDPYDLVATDSGKLVVASGSGQWTDILSYNAETGVLLGQNGIRQRSRLALHPSQNWVFAADSDLSPSDIEKFDISGTGITRLGDSPYHGYYRMNGNIWATPDSQHVITRGGDVFLASDMTYVLSLTATGVMVNSLVFDESAGEVQVLGSDGTLYEHDYLTSFARTGSANNLVNPLHLLRSGDKLYVISQGISGLELQELSQE